MLWALVGLAWADEVFAEAADPRDKPFEEPEAELAAELGGAWSAGNTDSRTLTSSFAGAYRFHRNQIGSKGGLILGSAKPDTDGDGTLSEEERKAERVETARQAQALLRYDRFITERSSVYVLAGAYTDPYTGYDSRFNAQTGYSRQLFLAEKPAETEEGSPTTLTRVHAEVGLDFAREDFAEGVEPELERKVSGRAGLSVAQLITPGLLVSDDVEVFVNVRDPRDTRAVNILALSNQLSDKMAVKLSYKLTYDTDPVEGYVKADHVGLITLVATVF